MITTLGMIPSLLIKTKHLCNNFWQLSDGRLRCKVCRHVFNPRKGLIKISPRILRKIIQEFVLEHSTNVILARVNVSKYKLLKILTLLRIAMTKDVPEVFSGIVEVDETYLGGQMKNRKLKNRIKYGKNRLGAISRRDFSFCAKNWNEPPYFRKNCFLGFRPAV